MLICDLHNDLLSFLAKEDTRTPDDEGSKASYGQLVKGHVKTQVLALFSPTRQESSVFGLKQATLFSRLPEKYPTYFSHYPSHSTQIHILPAIENASVFAEEEEPLETSLQRLSLFEKALRQIVYVSLTWNTENRFGGGNESKVGLKPDGEILLKHLSRKKIAVDLSHTSDHLAEEILSYNDAHNLDLMFLASHSNFREITNHPRNLPRWLADEIIRRKGIIGLNFFSPFVGSDAGTLAKHVSYALELGGENSLSLGADFFDVEDLSYFKEKYGEITPFFPEYPNASCYPSFLSSLQLPPEQILKIASHNAQGFLKKRELSS